MRLFFLLFPKTNPTAIYIDENPPYFFYQETSKMPPIPEGDYSSLIEWQSRIPDNVLLSQLTIPGTHNSAAHHTSFPSVRCQGAPVNEQLKHGVRFFDFRVARPYLANCGNSFGSSPDDLQVVHGDFPVRLPFPVKLDDELNVVYAFLQQHPSEVVIVSIKMEGVGAWEGDDFPNLIWSNYVGRHEERWFLENKIPLMGEARGKVVLFRRFGLGDAATRNNDNFGFEASWWKYNTPEDDRGRYVVQDWNEVNKPEDIQQKVHYINAQVERAVTYNSTAESAQGDTAKIYVNFCSGSNFWNPQCWPHGVSKHVNKSIETAPAGMGLIIVDYAEAGDWDVPRRLVNHSIQTVGGGHKD